MEASELYQELIIDHGTNPRNHFALEYPSHSAVGFNPLCGDKISLYLALQNNAIDKISFTGTGCAISMASASIMTEILQTKNLQETKQLFQDFTNMLLTTEEAILPTTLGKLQALAGVKQFPTRVKCATLAWHTLIAALKNQHTVSTE